MLEKNLVFLAAAAAPSAPFSSAMYGPVNVQFMHKNVQKLTYLI